MIGVNDAAELLGVSKARVRMLIAEGRLQAEKVGNAWAINESDVERRRLERPQAGRPKKQRKIGPPPLPDVDEAHRLYKDCKRVLTGCYDTEFLMQAKSREEKLFWVRVADFFLQQKQEELVEQGVF